MRQWDPRLSLRIYKRLAPAGQFRIAPPALLAAGFLALIFVGALLLWLPISVHQPVSFLNSLFSATSAVTITGLSTVDIGSTYTVFGQAVLTALVQLGGLGFVTLSVVAILTLGKRISLQHQALAQEAFNQTNVSMVRHTAAVILKITLFAEAVGVVLFTVRWWQDTSFLDALGRAIFHTVAAFNNAGLMISSTQMTHYQHDAFILLLTSILIIAGGLGFSVIDDIRNKRCWRTLSPYSRVAIAATLGLNLVGFVFIWLLERHNPATLGNLSWVDQGLAAWFQSVTTRTAGFNSVDIGALNDSTALFMMLFMFIGGGSLGLAGGIKVGTFVVLMAAAYAYIFQRPQVVLAGRAVPEDAVQKALALLLITVTLVFVATLVLTVTESAPFLSIAFEVVSAISTTGLTRGITADLSVWGRLFIIALMFIGRLGPLTLIYSLSIKRRGLIRYPESSFQVG